MHSKNKIKSLRELTKIIASLKRRNKRIVFTNGCFDILHFGHIRYLEEAKNKGDILIVGLNSDSSVKKIKDRRRPINPQSIRAKILASLAIVDYVVIFNDLTPLNLIKRLKPDILIKGGDWSKQDIVGKDIVNSYGGKVISTQYYRGQSTTVLIKSIVNKYGKSKNR